MNLFTIGVIALPDTFAMTQKDLGGAFGQEQVIKAACRHYASPWARGELCTEKYDILAS